MQLLLQWNSNTHYTFWVCLWPQVSSMHSASAVLCCLWPSRHYHIFPHYLINSTILGKKIYWTQNVFWFSVQILSEIFLILRRNERDIVEKCLSVFMYSTGYCCQILMKLEFSRKIFEKKKFNIQFHENPSSESRVVSCGRTDGRTWRSYIKSLIATLQTCLKTEKLRIITICHANYSLRKAIRRRSFFFNYSHPVVLH